MRAVSRLSTNALARRRLRTVLLIAAVALSTSLATAVACALQSLSTSMDNRVAEHLGAADVQVRHIAKDRFDGSIVAALSGRDDVVLVAPRTREAVTLQNTITGEQFACSVRGIVPGVEERMSAFVPDVGRGIEADDEIVVERFLAEELGLEVGGTVFASADGTTRHLLKIVGLIEPKAITLFNKPQAHVPLGSLQSWLGPDAGVREINVQLRDGVDAAGFVDEVSGLVPRDVMVRESERVTSRVDGLVRVNKMGFAVTLTLANLAAAVIVLTGLTTGVLERQRELAILRCVGGRRWQLGAAQLAVGGTIGAAGAAFGVPLGILLAWIVTVMFPDRIPTGLQLWPLGLALAGGGAVVAGLIGGLWPAISAARTSPLRALSPRARRVGARGVIALTIAAMLGISVHAAVLLSTDNADAGFATRLGLAVPALLTGYMALGAPILIILARALGPAISAALGLPRHVLVRTTLATPYRNGFTAGALMLGLAIMTVVQTNGHALMRDWVGSMRFPDAFINGLFGGLNEERRARVEALDFVERTSAISMFRVDSNAFGISGMNQPMTTFIAFDPAEFFEMTEIHWIEGDAEYARRRLEEGGAVVVAQEFLVGRDGFGVGDTFTVEYRGEPIEFEIVGAVSAPGLDLVSKYFHMEDDYAEQAFSAVFGTRADMKRHFGFDSIHLIQIELRGDISDAEAVERLRATIKRPGLVVGSGREIKEEILKIGHGMMRVSSVVAIGAMLVGCAGVLNIVIAGIEVRKYEFGVLRSIGAGGWTIGRLVIGETILVILTACVLGIMMGLHIAWAESRIYTMIAGIEFTPIPPVGPIALGCAILATMTLATVAPAIARLSVRRPLELLSATRG